MPVAASPETPIEFIGFIGNNNGSETTPRTGPLLDVTYIETLAKAHENAGFDRALLAFHSTLPDCLQVGQHVASVTERLNVFIAQRPGFTAPTLLARQFATLDHLTRGRISLNVITGGDSVELAQDGNTIDDKDERYARTSEFLDVVRAEWTSAAPFGWIMAGVAAMLATYELGLEKEVYLLAGLLMGYGLISHVAIRLARAGKSAGMLTGIVGDFSGMPEIMKRLALVQFFSWSALFIMWINTTPIVAKDFFGASDPASAAYQQAGNWVGVLFSVYNGVAALAALTLLPFLARRFGKARTHIFGLLCGAAGYASFFVIRDPQWLILSEIGVGIAWASILAMPYAILASSLPQAKLGIFMGLFNVFVVVPQLLVATVMGSIMKRYFPGEPIWTMAFAAGTLVLAAMAMTRVKVPGE